jgi:Flp pilus assembly pilin Flp
VTTRRGDDGAAMVEYILLVTFVALAAATAVGLLGGSVLDLFDVVEGRFPG